ncbi:ribonuclease J [Allofustis seminis]|uniref:ribonuclease J n=1 Tax=Allofustis seminis TaxID=166939 RepID=UPI000374633E|nr:ribonuclease J [Allofustis seminis]
MSKIKIIPLGGVRENAKNMYVIEIDDAIFVLDCGLLYPEEMFGIDAVIPDFTYLEENQDKIAGVFLSHGHEDSIGALPYFLERFEVPVFGSELTIALAKMYVEEAKLDYEFDDYHVVDEEMEIDFGTATIRFFRVTHTIPDSMGIAVKTDAGHIVYTGNFKFDNSASGDYTTDYAEIVQIGKEGVLALLSDSLGAASLEENVSDVRVQEEVFNTFKNTENRLIVAAVASNMLRIQQVINAASHFGRKIFIAGKRMESILAIALKLNKLTVPDKDLFVPMSEINKYKDNQIVILETGSLGEPLDTLRKMSEGRHPQITIKEGDLVYIVTSPSTAMEIYAAEARNSIYRAGGTVKALSSQVKASGHGTPKDLQLMINLLKPKYLIPVQGQYRMLVAHSDLAHLTGMRYENIFIVSNGEVLIYENGKMMRAGEVSATDTLIDGIGVGDIGNVVLRDRRLLSEDGIFVAVLTIDRKKKKIIAGPHIVTRGFVFVRESQSLLDEASGIVTKIMNKQLEKNDFEWGELKAEIRKELLAYLSQKTGRRPIVLPVIMEINQKRWYDK